MTRFASQDEINQKILNGEYTGPDGAVALHWHRFKKTPKGRRRNRERVKLATTLYSARKKMQVLKDFRGFIEPLIAHVSVAFDAGNVDALDSISTQLAWWSGVERDCYPVQKHMAECAAIETCELGLELTELEPLGGHTRALIALTYADLLFRTGAHQSHILGCVYVAEVRAMCIKDPNQKARAYRRLAHLWFFRLRHPIGLWYFLKARNVPGIAADVKAKNKL